MRRLGLVLCCTYVITFAYPQQIQFGSRPLRFPRNVQPKDANRPRAAFSRKSRRGSGFTFSSTFDFPFGIGGRCPFFVGRLFEDFHYPFFVEVVGICKDAVSFLCVLFNEFRDQNKKLSHLN